MGILDSSTKHLRSKVSIVKVVQKTKSTYHINKIIRQSEWLKSIQKKMLSRVCGSIHSKRKIIKEMKK